MGLPVGYIRVASGSFSVFRGIYMKERPKIETHVRRLGSSNTVEDKGPLKKSYLGFKDSYGTKDFSDRTYAYNSHGSLATRISTLDWVLAFAKGKGDTVYPTPLSLKALGVHLGFIGAGQKLGSAGKGLKTLSKTMEWCRTHGFVVAANSGHYSKADKECRKYYVNKSKIEAFFRFLVESGKMAPRAEIPPERRETPEELFERVESTLYEHKGGMEWLEKVQVHSVHDEGMKIPVVSAFGVSHEDLCEYVRLKVSENSEIFRLCRDISLELNAGFGATPGDPLYVSCEPNVKFSGRKASPVADRVTFRPHSDAALLKSHDGILGSFEGSEREAYADAVFGAGRYIRKDEKGSVHHRLMCLNRGWWSPSGNEDIYSVIHWRAYGKPLNPEDRPDFKRKLQRAVLADTAGDFAHKYVRHMAEEAKRTGGTEAAKSVWKGYDSTRERLEAEFLQLKDAYRQVCGKDIGSRIFMFEGLHTLIVQKLLWLGYGLRSFGIYDEIVVEKRGFSDAELTDIVEKLLEKAFTKVLGIFRSGELRHEHRPAQQLSVGVERRIIDIDLYLKRCMER